MAEGRRRETWIHTSNLLAWIQNFGFRKTAWVEPSKLNPMAPVEKPVKAPLSFLRDVFVKKP